jgi:hypothetical protein
VSYSRFQAILELTIERKLKETSNDQIRSFLIFGTLTAKISTVRKDGSHNEAPIWFILDNDEPEINVVFTTGHHTLKAKNILRDPRVSLSIVDQTPPPVYCNRGNCGNKSRIGFRLSPKMDDENCKTKYGTRRCGAYGKKNIIKADFLVKIRTTTIIGQRDVVVQIS